MKYKHIYFDLDGTIIDSSPGVLNSVLQVLKKYNLDKYDLEELKHMLIGPPLFYGLQNLTKIEDDDFINLLVKEFRKEYSRSGVFENKLYDGIKTLLENLYNLGCNLEILTSKPQRFVKIILKQHDIERYFSKIDGAKEYDRQSLKSEKLKKLVQGKEDISIMIGDRVEDIIAGQNNNIDTIAVTYGFDNVELLYKQKPTYFANSPLAILGLLR